MKPAGPKSPAREATTVEPGSTSVSKSDWRPEAHQRIQSEPKPEKTPITQPAQNTLQEPRLQAETIVQHQAEFQQDPKAQQKGSLATPTPQQPPPNRSVHLEQQEATSHEGHGSGTVSKTQQGPESTGGHVAPSGRDPAKPSPTQQEAEPTPTAPAITEPLVQTKSISQEKPQLADPPARQTPPPMPEARWKPEWGFLTRLQELSIQRSAQEWKTFFEWVTDPERASDLGSSSETSPPGLRSVLPGGVTLAFKKRQKCEDDPAGYSRVTPPGKKTCVQNHKHFWDTEEPGQHLCEIGSGLTLLSVHVDSVYADQAWDLLSATSTETGPALRAVCPEGLEAIWKVKDHDSVGPKVLFYGFSEADGGGGEEGVTS